MLMKRSLAVDRLRSLSLPSCGEALSKLLGGSEMLVSVVVQSFGRREIYLYCRTFQPSPAISSLPLYQLRSSSAATPGFVGASTKPSTSTSMSLAAHASARRAFSRANKFSTLYEAQVLIERRRRH